MRRAHLGAHPCIARRDQRGHDADPTPTTNPDPHPHQADQREAKFTVKIIDDDRFEKAESFRVTLSEPSEGCELDTKGTIAMVRGASMAGLGTTASHPARDAARSQHALLTRHAPCLHTMHAHHAVPCCTNRAHTEHNTACGPPTDLGRPSLNDQPSPKP